MVLLVFTGIFLFFFIEFYVIILFLAVGVLLWASLGLRKFESSKRLYPIVIYLLIIIFIIGSGGFLSFVGLYLAAIAALHYYFLYMHQPTVELFS